MNLQAFLDRPISDDWLDQPATALSQEEATVITYVSRSRNSFRRGSAAAAVVVLATASALLASGPASADPADGSPFPYTGSQVSLTAPADAQALQFVLVGGSGGNAAPYQNVTPPAAALGSTVSGYLYVLPGLSQFQLFVGGAGVDGADGGAGGGGYFAGGPGGKGWFDQLADGGGGGGGGASGLLLDEGLLAVAGGGGGTGGVGLIDAADATPVAGGAGGAGGSTAGSGGSGQADSDQPAPAGGAGGSLPGGDGEQGGDGTITQVTGEQVGGGGGGGAGASGGAGGEAVPALNAGGSGGGGGAGSSTVLADLIDDPIVGTASGPGDGSIDITWITDYTLSPLQGPTQVTAGSDPNQYTVTGIDQNGNPIEDYIQQYVTFSSSDTTDVVTGNTIVMTDPGVRTVAATWGVATSQLQVTVTAASMQDPSTSTSVTTPTTSAATTSTTPESAGPPPRSDGSASPNKPGTGSPTSLAATGVAHPDHWTALAAALLLIGAMLTFAARRRTTGTARPGPRA